MIVNASKVLTEPTFINYYYSCTSKLTGTDYISGCYIHVKVVTIFVGHLVLFANPASCMRYLHLLACIIFVKVSGNSLIKSLTHSFPKKKKEKKKKKERPPLIFPQATCGMCTCLQFYKYTNVSFILQQPLLHIPHIKPCCINTYILKYT